MTTAASSRRASFHALGVFKVDDLLLVSEMYVPEKLGQENPLFFVSHGGSGSVKHIIATALDVGVVKMYMYTDTQ